MIFFAGCENMVHYSGTIIDDQNDSCLTNVNILVVMNNIVQDRYGIMIPDTIQITERDSLRRLKTKGDNSETKDLNKNKYFRFEPIKSDSLGRFSIGLHEGCIFGCPDYDIRFEKNGYISFQMKGDWNSNENLVIRLKKK